MLKPQLISHTDKLELGTKGAARIIQTIEDALAEQGFAHISLTGGTMGIAVLEAMSHSPALAGIDFSKVHFWWSDERFVATGHADRNEQQAKDALLSKLAIPAQNLHIMGASDRFESAEEAAAAYEEELRSVFADSLPVFDLTLLGMGPDGHIASLFPDRQEVHVQEGLALAVHDSPKPPPTRVSLTLPVIQGSKRIWFLIAGADKAEATERLLAAAQLDAGDLSAEILTATPAAGARGSEETLILATEDALTTQS